MVSKEQQQAIGKEIVEGLLKPTEAPQKYGISRTSAQKYATDYRRANGLPVRAHSSQSIESQLVKLKAEAGALDLEDYRSMTKEQLIEEIIKSKINEARAKKGYEVKGDGQNKEFISLNNKNLKS